MFPESHFLPSRWSLESGKRAELELASWTEKELKLHFRKWWGIRGLSIEVLQDNWQNVSTSSILMWKTAATRCEAWTYNTGPTKRSSKEIQHYSAEKNPQLLTKLALWVTCSNRWTMHIAQSGLVPVGTACLGRAISKGPILRGFYKGGSYTERQGEERQAESSWTSL